MSKILQNVTIGPFLGVLVNGLGMKTFASNIFFAKLLFLWLLLSLARLDCLLVAWNAQPAELWPSQQSLLMCAAVATALAACCLAE